MENWKHITDIETISKIIENSTMKPQLIFKDSVTCGISAYAKERLVLGSKQLEEQLDINYLDLLSYRNISNHIAEVFGVIHQSPQVIVLINKEVIYNVTHHSIQVDGILSKL